MSINPKNIKFNVSNGTNNNIVSLSIGDFAIDVCDKPEGFPDFLDSLIKELTIIKNELREYYE